MQQILTLHDSLGTERETYPEQQTLRYAGLIGKIYIQEAST